MSDPIKPAETTTAVSKQDKPMEFVPFGAQDAIKLTISIVKKLVAVPTKTGKLPTDDDALKFIMMCSAKKLNPFEQDAFLIGYDTRDGAKFSLITAHQAFLKRAEMHKEYDGMLSGTIVVRDGKMVELEGDFHLDDDTIIGGWATVYFKNRSHPMHKKIRLSRFNTGMSQWAKDPAGMICKCAEADALRSSFPTLLGGLYMQEELDRGEPEKKVVAPIFVDQTKAITEVVQIKQPTAADYLKQLEELCKAAEIKMEDLTKFMLSIGMIPEGKTKIEEASIETLKTAIENLSDIAERINEEAKSNAK